MGSFLHWRRCANHTCGEVPSPNQKVTVNGGYVAIKCPAHHAPAPRQPKLTPFLFASFEAGALSFFEHPKQVVVTYIDHRAGIVLIGVVAPPVCTEPWAKQTHQPICALIFNFDIEHGPDRS